MVDARESLLKAIKNSFSCVIPVLDATQNWGALDKSEDGEDVKEYFKSSIKDFIGSFDGNILLFVFLIQSYSFNVFGIVWLVLCTFMSMKMFSHPGHLSLGVSLK